MALLKGQEMGRFNSVPPLSTCLHRVKSIWLSNWKACLSRKLASRWQYLPESFVTPDAELAPLPAEEIEAERDASPLVDDKK
ncbi:hypothetical protein ACVXHA_18670 [Escherichia coli]